MRDKNDPLLGGHMPDQGNRGVRNLDREDTRGILESWTDRILQEGGDALENQGPSLTVPLTIEPRNQNVKL
jgi:hypothetical protein